MARFNLDDYVGVHTRVEKLRSDHKLDAEIKTGIQPIEGGVIVQAAISLNDRVVATGMSFCTPSEGPKVLEKAETVAVGRATAFMGYEVKQGIASQEEMRDFQDQSKPRLDVAMGEGTDAAKEIESLFESLDLGLQSWVLNKVTDKKVSKTKAAIKAAIRGLSPEESRETMRLGAVMVAKRAKEG